MHSPTHRASALVLALLTPVLALIGCSDPTQPGSTDPVEGPTLLSLSPADQVGSPGLPVSPLSVVVRDARGNPLPAVQVTFTVITGQSRLSPRWQMTDAFGVATADWLLGAPGENVATASVARIGTVTFRATSVFDHGSFPGGDYGMVSREETDSSIPVSSSGDVLHLYPDGRFSRDFNCGALAVAWCSSAQSGFYAIEGQRLVLRYLSLESGAMQHEEVGVFESAEVFLIEDHSAAEQTRIYMRLPNPPPSDGCDPANPWDYC